LVLHQIGQDPEWLGTQRNFFRPTAQEAAVEIQSEVAKRVSAMGPFAGVWFKAPQPGLLTDWIFLSQNYHPVITTSKARSV
jgi:hypothetical protein